MMVPAGTALCAFPLTAKTKARAAPRESAAKQRSSDKWVKLNMGEIKKSGGCCQSPDIIKYRLLATWRGRWGIGISCARVRVFLLSGFAAGFFAKADFGDFHFAVRILGVGTAGRISHHDVCDRRCVAIPGDLAFRGQIVCLVVNCEGHSIRIYGADLAVKFERFIVRVSGCGRIRRIIRTQRGDYAGHGGSNYGE
jgi:hypothetical protein